MSTPLEQIAQAIIEHQQAIMGPVARILASRVDGMELGPPLRITGHDPVSIVEDLVRTYSSLTGPLGIRMCYQAAAHLLSAHPDTEIPIFADYRHRGAS